MSVNVGSGHASAASHVKESDTIISKVKHLYEVAVEESRAELAHIAGSALAQLLPCSSHSFGSHSRATCNTQQLQGD